MKIKPSALFTLFIIFQLSLNAGQPYIIDQLVGIVGSGMFKQSDIETEYLRQRSQSHSFSSELKCDIYENLLGRKLLLNQAKLDSIKVSEAQIEARLNENLNGFIAQFGSTEKLEKQYNKPLSEIKANLRDMFREEQMIQGMQRSIIGEIKITPSEIKNFYDKVSKDSLPYLNPQIEYAQLAIYPAYTEQSILEVKNRLLEMRKDILAGQKFESLAIMYSEDEGTARQQGETGFLTKAKLDPEYAKAAFALNKPGEVSRIVESQFGFHIIQLIEKRGDMINTRHILLKPKPDPDAVARALSALDSIRTLITKDSITFEKAVAYYSMDQDTRFNRGIVVNPSTGSTKFEMDQTQLVPADYDALKKLKLGELSNSYLSRDKNNKIFYKIVVIKSQTPAHRVNMTDDFNLIQEIAKNQKRLSIIQDWFTIQKQTTYIRINDAYKNCNFKTEGWIKDGM